MGDQETRLTAVEENIQSIIILAFFYGLEKLLNLTVLGIYVFYSVLFLFLALQMIDVDLNERLTALEDKENSNIKYTQINFLKFILLTVEQLSCNNFYIKIS